MGELSATRFRVELNQQLCVCSQACSVSLPEVFEADGYEMKVILPEPPADLSEDLADVEEACPTSAITLTEIED